MKKILCKVFGNEKVARWLGVSIGKNCRILTTKFGSEPWLITIGDNVTVSFDVVFINHDGVGWLFKDENGRRYKYSKIRVGDNCFIGAQSIILPGVCIGNNCVIGAGSVLTKSVPDGCVVAGNPARYITTYDELMARIKSWPSESYISGEKYRSRVSSILDDNFRPEIK